MVALVALGCGCGSTVIVVQGDDAGGDAGGAGPGAGGAGGQGSAVTTTSTASGMVCCSGRVEYWPESIGSLQLIAGEVTYHPEQIVSGGVTTWWSIADHQSGYWYGDTEETDVAHANGTDHVSQIVDAGALDYNPWYVGPLGEGTITVVRRGANDGFLAVRFDAFYVNPEGEFPYGYADVTWYSSADADFSEFADTP